MNATKAGKLSLLKSKKPRETTHAIVLDHEAVEAFARAQQVHTAAVAELRLARRRMEPEETMAELQALVDEAKQRMDELEPAAEDGVGVVSVKLRAMAPLAYAALKAQYPPTDEDHRQVQVTYDDEKAKAAWNQSEFAPRLVATCVVDPEATVDDVREWREAWGDPDWNRLVKACTQIHEETVNTASLVFSSGRTRN